MLTQKRFMTVCNSGFKAFRKKVPNRKTRGVSYVNKYGNRVRGSTGNLELNATSITFIKGNVAKVVISGDIAPYLPYTHLPWLSERWKGHKNPNEGWIDRATDTLAKTIAKRLKGTVVKK